MALNTANMNDPDPFVMLFTAKWNVPQASLALGYTPCKESWEKVKELFKVYCKEHPIVHKFTSGHDEL
jgi:hypothetical protein